MTTADRFVAFFLGPACLVVAVLLVVMERTPAVIVVAGVVAAVGFKATFTYEGSLPDVSSLETFLYSSAVNVDLIAVEMNSKKVIVGWVSAMSLDSSTDWFRIMPLATGSVEGGRIKFTTFYERKYES